MSRTRIALTGIALASLALSNGVVGQQPATQQPTQQPAPTQRANDNPNVPSQQSDRQTPPVQTQQDRRLMGNMQGVSLPEALVRKLKKSGEGEVELAQMAKEKIEDQGFREFTQMVIEDHQVLNQQLDKFVSASGRETGAAPANSNREGNITAPTPQNREQPNNNRPNQDPAQRDATRGQAGDAARPTDAPVREGQLANGRGVMVPQQLCAIMEQACENNLEMTKKMLQEHEGQDFQMAYLGQQIVAHTAALAELKAIESAGPAELKAVAQQATPKIQEHLDMAKKLAKKFEDDRGAGKRGERDQAEGNERR